jgi:hypothetical protein
MTTTPELTDANGNPEETLPGAPAVTAREDAEQTPDAPEAAKEPSESDETFPRAYVEKLRDESAKYRQRAQKADDLAARLHKALVASTGKLADPEDLPFSEAHLDDAEALAAAVDDLLARKPHLASRKPRGDVGQGITSAPSTSVDLAGILRARAS